MIRSLVRVDMKFLEPSQYQNACNELFQQYQASIIAVLPTARVEHIGASSINGAISKGDLDIFVAVSADEFEMAIQVVSVLGFKEKLDTLRTPELCMLESISGDDIAVQLVSTGSQFEDFLSFRDAIRTDSGLLQQYNQLKRQFEGKSHSSYRAAKSKFIEQVLASL